MNSEQQSTETAGVGSPDDVAPVAMSLSKRQATESDYAPLTIEQIEALVEEVIEANAVWPDPLPSQVSAVMDVVREAMAQAWDERGLARAQYLGPDGGHYNDECAGWEDCYCGTFVNPYREVVLPPGEAS